MISRGMSRDPFAGDFVRQREHGVAGASRFESPDFLKVVTFEMDRRAKYLIDR